MKKMTFFLILQMSLASLNAQYIKMPLDTNHYWLEYCEYYKIHSGPIAYQFRVKKDTVVNGTTYKLLSSGNSDCTLLSDNPILLRQDTLQRRVVILKNNQERILYNFNKNVGDTAQLYCLYGNTHTYTLSVKDSVLLNDGLYHRRFNFGGSGPGNIIEGVGGTRGLLSPFCNTFNTYRHLICLAKKSSATTIYSNPDSFLDCSPSLGISSNELPFKSFSVFPNPAENYINVTTEGGIPDSIELINCLGKPVKVIHRQEGRNILIDITQLPSGVYLLKSIIDSQPLYRILIKN